MQQSEAFHFLVKVEDVARSARLHRAAEQTRTDPSISLTLLAASFGVGLITRGVAFAGDASRTTGLLCWMGSRRGAAPSGGHSTLKDAVASQRAAVACWQVVGRMRSKCLLVRTRGAGPSVQQLQEFILFQAMTFSSAQQGFPEVGNTIGLSVFVVMTSAQCRLFLLHQVPRSRTFPLACLAWHSCLVREFGASFARAALAVVRRPGAPLWADAAPQDQRLWEGTRKADVTTRDVVGRWRFVWCRGF